MVDKDQNDNISPTELFAAESKLYEMMVEYLKSAISSAFGNVDINEDGKVTKVGMLISFLPWNFA